MPHVPAPGHSRSSHRLRTRTTHNYDAQFSSHEGGIDAAEQASIDGVPAQPVIITNQQGTPGYSLDFTPPGIPTDLTLSSVVGLDKDGRSILKLIATVTQPTDADLFATQVEVTAENDGAEVPSPIWGNAAIILIGVEATSGAIEGVRGLTQYWARARAVDVTGNYSDYSTTTSITTAKDNEAPGQPQDVVTAGGFKGMGLHWSPSTAADLMFVEIRYAPDDGSGTGPDTSLWQIIRVRTNTVWIDGLTIGTKYWSQVRAVDFSGNTVTSTSDPTAVDYLSFPEAGWTGLAPATPVAVGAADVAFNSVLTNILAANRIDAGTIETGILRINTTDGSMADGVEIYLSGLKVGRWDETGLYIGSNAAGLPTDLSASDYVRLTDAGLTVYLHGVAQAAITPNGINATAVNFGALPGGHNLLQNSSFELADFAAAPSAAAWDVAADWTATQVSNTNATNGANSVTQTASTY